jgi:hypothetical protein
MLEDRDMSREAFVKLAAIIAQQDKMVALLEDVLKVQTAILSYLTIMEVTNE